MERYQVSVVLTDKNVKPKRSKYTIAIIINGIGNDENATQISPPDYTHYSSKCGLKILRVRRDGQMELKITPTRSVGAEMIAKKLNESQLEVNLTSRGDERVPIKIEGVDQNILTITLFFKDRNTISANLEFDTIAVRTVESVAFADNWSILPKYTRAAAVVPIQYSDEQREAAKFVQSTQQPTEIAVLSLSIILQLFFAFAMDQLMGMMNDLSFLTSLSMIAFSIPGIASPIQSLLLQIIYMDLLMTDKWLTPAIEKSLTIEEIDNDNPINMFLDEQGFGSQLLVLNLGSTLIFMGIQVALLLLTVLAYLLGHCCRSARKSYIYLRGRVLKQSAIAFVIQQFQPLLMSSVINVRSISIVDLGEYSESMRFSYALSLIIVVVIVISVGTFIYVIKQRRRPKGKILSPLIEGLKRRGIAYYWTILTLLKWSILCLTLILLSEYPAQQLQVLTALSILSTALQLGLKPQTSLVEQWMSFFNELAATLYLYALSALVLTDDLPLKETLGLVLLSITVGALSVNLLKLIILLISALIAKCRVSLNQDKVIDLQQSNKRFALVDEERPSQSWMETKQKKKKVKKTKRGKADEESKSAAREEIPQMKDKAEKEISQMKLDKKKKKKTFFKKKKAKKQALSEHTFFDWRTLFVPDPQY
ncbi:hypothetical protein FGO68_gene17388 [Halteria grandinella]|uniref:TRP C-terminal domain-containing protein n=1 Tax=Halteria grandinella TaxID=5974 RepID=A0A8J8P504_HALGN|nr:hypothetical protein FGO68_gene17388 [Halteria grandinella]